MSARVVLQRSRLEALLAGEDAALRAALHAALAAARGRPPIDEVRLRALWSEGLAVGAIASAMRERFGRVTSALRRLGLKRPMGWKPVGFRPGGGAGGARRVVDRDRLAAMAAEGRTTAAMAAALGCGEDTIRVRIKAWGIARVMPRSRGRPRQVDEAALRALWGDAGRTIADIAAALKVNASTVGVAAKRIGLPPRRGLVVRVRAPAVAPAATAPTGRQGGVDVAALRAMVEAGLAPAEIAARHDIVVGTVYRWLREHGLRPPRRAPGPDPAVAARLPTMWAADATLDAMAAALGVSRDTVRRMAMRLGLRRSRGWRPPAPVRARARTPAGPPRKATPPTPPGDLAAARDAIAAFIAANGVTRCPTTAVLPTQAALPAEAAGVLRQRAAERAAREQEELRARSLRGARSRGVDPRQDQPQHPAQGRGSP